MGYLAIQLGGCDIRIKRIGPYHWLRYTDGHLMLVWGPEGEGICGIDFYSREGKRLKSVRPLAYGSAGDWLFVKTEVGIYTVPQSEDGYSAGKPLDEDDLKGFLSKHALVMPKMKTT